MGLLIPNHNKNNFSFRLKHIRFLEHHIIFLIDNNLIKCKNQAEARRAIGYIFSKLNAANKYCAVFFLAAVARYLSHPEPIVQEVAAVAVSILISLIRRVLSDPFISDSVKKSIAEEFCAVFDKEIKEHLYLFNDASIKAIKNAVELAELIIESKNNNYPIFKRDQFILSINNFLTDTEHTISKTVSYQSLFKDFILGGELWI